MATYAQVMIKALKFAAANPPATDGLSAEELSARINEISEDLKGHGIGAADRLIMNEDRKVYRAALSKLNEAGK